MCEHLKSLIIKDTKTIRENPEPLTDKLIKELSKNNRLISMNVFENETEDNQMNICIDVLSKAGNEEVEVRKYVVDDQVLDTYIVIPLTA
jgi:hypothetical protein